MTNTPIENPLRSFNTEVREPWNPVIHSMLKTVDLHTLYLIKTGDPYHEKASEHLRNYVRELKSWILDNERTRLKKNG